LRSPSTTSLQVTGVADEPVDQVSQWLVPNAWPVDRLAHHSPVSWRRASRSALPSPFRSPSRTSIQVTGVSAVPVAQVSQWLVVNAKPTDRLAHHSPVSLRRASRSALPSPL